MPVHDQNPRGKSWSLLSADRKRNADDCGGVGRSTRALHLCTQQMRSHYSFLRPLCREGEFLKADIGSWPQDARSTLTLLNRGSRSMWMFKTMPSGQVGSARRSATVLAVTGTPGSISTLILSR